MLFFPRLDTRGILVFVGSKNSSSGCSLLALCPGIISPKLLKNAKNTALGDIYYGHVGGDLCTINKLFNNNLSLLYFLIRGFLIKWFMVKQIIHVLMTKTPITRKIVLHPMILFCTGRKEHKHSLQVLRGREANARASSCPCWKKNILWLPVWTSL